MKDLRLAPLRLLWVTLPFTLGPLLAGALDPRDHTFRRAVSLACWAVWAMTLVAALIPRVATLTAVRIVAPATMAAAAWATAVGEVDAKAVLGLAAATALTISALVAPVGEAFVNGSSYGDERRMPLRPPGPLLLGPIELAWFVTAAGFTTGPLLLSVQRWVAGVIATAAGVPLALLAGRALHQLSRRWLVFVPAGFVLHDHMALADPALFVRGAVAQLRLAPADTAARDLTAGALGAAVEATFHAPVSIVPARRDQVLEPIDVTQILIAPSRPGAVLTEAQRRRLPTAASGRG